MKIMCSCVGIEIQSYENQVCIPNWWNGKDICIDACLVEEIKYLWDNRIITTGCCCGHNILPPMINVREDYHQKMIDLGYQYFRNKFNSVIYKPKSIKCDNWRPKWVHLQPKQKKQWKKD